MQSDISSLQKYMHKAWCVYTKCVHVFKVNWPECYISDWPWTSMWPEYLEHRKIKPTLFISLAKAAMNISRRVSASQKWVLFRFYVPWWNDRGHIVFDLAVCLSVVNFSISYNFWTIKGRYFIFGMHTQLIMSLQLKPRVMMLWLRLWPVRLKKLFRFLLPPGAFNISQ